MDTGGKPFDVNSVWIALHVLVLVETSMVLEMVSWLHCMH